jgi:hypothetical protein
MTNFSLLQLTILLNALFALHPAPIHAAPATALLMHDDALAPRLLTIRAPLLPDPALEGSDSHALASAALALAPLRLENLSLPTDSSPLLSAALLHEFPHASA